VDEVRVIAHDHAQKPGAAFPHPVFKRKLVSCPKFGHHIPGRGTQLEGTRHLGLCLEAHADELTGQEVNLEPIEVPGAM